MRGVVLPGDRGVEFREVADPTPGPGQVVVGVRASGLCGSDLRVIYRRSRCDPTPYRNGTIAGHEPAGDVLAVGTGVRSVRPDDRVAVYHVSGCGHCPPCRSGWRVACESPERSAYGYHRHGAHAPYLLAEERDLVVVPDPVSYADAAMAACGLGTAYQALARAEASARDRVLVVGLGPVGLGVALLAGALGAEVTAVEPDPQRRALGSRISGCLVHGADEDTDVRLDEQTAGQGFEVAVECSGTNQGRLLALAAARRRARVLLVGEGGDLSVEPSPQLIHKEITLIGSWVCSIATLPALFEFMVRTRLDAEAIVTHRFGRDAAAAAYQTFDSGHTGKVIIH